MENIRVLVDGKNYTSIEVYNATVLFRNPDDALEFIADYFDLITFIGVEKEFATEEYAEQLKHVLSYKKCYHPETEVIAYHATEETVQDISSDVDGWDEQTDSIETPQELG